MVTGMTVEGSSSAVPPEIRGMIESWPAIPAFVRDRHLTVLAANDLARSLSPAFHDGVDLVRATFVDSDAMRTSPSRAVIAEHFAGTLRESLARHESDDAFERIVTDLSTTSSAFAEAWANGGGSRDEADAFAFPNDVVGPLTLTYQQLNIPRVFDLTLVVWRPVDENSRVALGRLAEIVAGAAEA